MIFLADAFPGVNGFLGTRGSFMLDFVFVALFAILPILAWSIRLVKQKKYQLHKQIQIVLGLVLLVAIVAFEVDLQVITRPWTARAIPSPYFQDDHKWSCPVGICLFIHLCFAVPTAVLWVLVIVRALRKFPSPPRPNEYSGEHKRFAWLAAIGMFLTASTGWVFYYLAFVAVK